MDSASTDASFRVLIVGDASSPAGQAAALKEELSKAGHEALVAADVPSALGAIADQSPHLVIVTAGVGPDDVAALLAVKASASPGPANIVVLAADTRSQWITRLLDAQRRRGQQPSYPDSSGPLSADDNRKKEGKTFPHPLSALSRRFFCRHCPPGVPIVGHSDAMVRTLELIRTVSQSRCNPVLILGETGTGKELAALAVHWWQYGTAERFVAVNCATLTANLLESELFGHVKGAFTGADREKTALLELADGGTIYLDEISEMPMELQARLLRFLQEKTFRKVGGTADIVSNARIIASSNCDLFQRTISEKFRRDLYYRLAVLPITMPPLRSTDRRIDIALLAEYFLEQFNSFGGQGACDLTGEAKEALMRHDWPGNVRELQNVIERAAILAKGSPIKPELLMIEQSQQPSAPASVEPKGASESTLETAEREFIFRALREAGWQRSRAASMLGIARATLHAKIKRYDIKIPAAGGHDVDPPSFSMDTHQPPVRRIDALRA